MSHFGVSRDRLDIEQYIKVKRKVSIQEIYNKFFDGRDQVTFKRELDMMIDKSKKAFEISEKNGNRCSYIDTDGNYFTYNE